MKHRVRKIGGGITVVHIMTVAIWFSLTVIAYIGFRPIEVYKFDIPYEVMNENKVVAVGEPVLVKQKYCKLQPYPSRIDIAIVDGYTEALRTIESNVPVGCYDKVSATAIVPLGALEGDYKISYTFTVRINPFRTETYRTESETFKVIKPVDEAVSTTRE